MTEGGFVADSFFGGSKPPPYKVFICLCKLQRVVWEPEPYTVYLKFVVGDGIPDVPKDSAKASKKVIPSETRNLIAGILHFVQNDFMGGLCKNHPLVA